MEENQESVELVDLLKQIKNYILESVKMTELFILLFNS